LLQVLQNDDIWPFSPSFVAEIENHQDRVSLFCRVVCSGNLPSTCTCRVCEREL